MQRTYVWADGQPLAQIESVSTLAGTTLEEIHYLHTDHLNTPRLATDQNQSVVWRWEGNAFGDTASIGGAIMNLRFPGQYYDSETGLYYNWHRYYDPRIGRYITSDPIGLRGGLNTYSFVANNPVRWSDRFGLAIGDFPPPPPGSNSTWPTGQYPNGRWWTEPSYGGGEKWVAHPEDEKHWRHWDKMSPDGKKKKGTWPDNPGKPRKDGGKEQKRLKPDQCPVDPNDDLGQWEPPVPESTPETPVPESDTEEPMPFMPWSEPWPVTRVPVRIPLWVFP